MIAFGAKCELARRRFFYFCKLMAPKFYREDRPYIVKLCDELQSFVESDKKVLIITLPPRFGKSRTAQMLVEWCFGKDRTQKVMTGSYNETLSTTFAKGVRDAIGEVKCDPYIPVYSDVFPGVRIKQGDASMSMWSLEGGFQSYLATSPKGTATGFGASMLIIDDLIKNAEEAFNETVKQKHEEWFRNTMLSRLEEGGKTIIIMTRWATDDLAGRALALYAEMGVEVVHIQMKAMQDDGTMLCDDILSADSFRMKKKAIGAEIFLANYQQEPIDIIGRLYSGFKTYTERPTFKMVKAYVDTADTGSDYLCAFVYGVTFDNEAYILDALYTKEPMEATEPKTAEMFHRHRVNIADIESNNGGRGFARAVDRILKESYRSNYTAVRPFTQSKNKQARIHSNATWCMDHVYFPENWRDRWSELYDTLLRYQKEGKNAHDDAPDALTGICENINGGEPKAMRVNY